MPGLEVEALPGQVRRGDSLIAGLELQFLGQLLKFIAHHRAVRQPQRQPPAHIVVDGKNAQFPAELLVIAALGLLPARHVIVELRLGRKGPSVDAGHHGVCGVAPPVGAG